MKYIKKREDVVFTMKLTRNLMQSNQLFNCLDISLQQKLFESRTQGILVAHKELLCITN